MEPPTVRDADSPVPVMTKVTPPAGAAIVAESLLPGAADAGFCPVVVSVQFVASPQLPVTFEPHTKLSAIVFPPIRAR